MRVAAAQIRCPWMDTAAGVRAVITSIERAAAADVRLVAFPETFLPGYPLWVALDGGVDLDDPRQQQVYAAYVSAAVEVAGPEVRLITECARDHGVFVYLGIAERDPGTRAVYCALLAIDPVAGVVGVHRKLVPTFEERSVWANGDGHGLRVHQTGPLRVGGLCCWENWMPLARQALYAQGPQLHVSVWPGSTRLTRDITRFVALEGRLYSLAAGALIDVADVPAGFPLRDEIVASPRATLYDGGSAIAGPDGRWIVEPVAGKEHLVVADVDPASAQGWRQLVDPSGLYARPDVFALEVDRRRPETASFTD